MARSAPAADGAARLTAAGRRSVLAGPAGLVFALALLLGPEPSLPQGYPASYAGQVLLPAMSAGLDNVMETPFETIRFSVTELELGFLAQTTVSPQALCRRS